MSHLVVDCVGPACGKPAKCKGLCSGHYQQHHRGQPLKPIKDGFRNRPRIVTDDSAECSRCSRILLLHEFTKGSGRNGLSTWCRRCFVCSVYGITRDDFEAILDAQEGLCALCGDDPGTESLHIDHDHSCCPGNRSCGVCVRSLICGTCNRGLGMFRDDRDLLLNAAAYVSLPWWKERTGHA